MHLFLIDLFVSIDILSPIIHQLEKKRVIICNINTIQNAKYNKLIKFFIKKKIIYINRFPLDFKKIFLYLFIKIIIFLPCKLQNKLRFLIRYLYLNFNLTSKNKIRNFLKKNKVKTITYEESAPLNKISVIYEIAKELNICVIKIPSGLNIANNKYIINKNKLKFCDIFILPNKIPKVDHRLKNKVKFFGSLRYTYEWFDILDRIHGKVKVIKNKIVIGFFKKYQSTENFLMEELIENLKKEKKFKIITREKPRDIFANKCNIFEKDLYTSSQLISSSNIIISSRPSSILLEAVLKNKKIGLLFYANGQLYKTPFFKSKLFLKFKNKNSIDYLLKKLKYKTKKNNKVEFLNKVLLYWEKQKIIKIKYKKFYKSLEV